MPSIVAPQTIIIRESDGSPSVNVRTLVMPNGSLTDDGAGQATVATGGGGFAAPLTVKDIDGTPSVATVNTIEFSNGLVSDQTGGVARVTITGSAMVQLDEQTVGGGGAASVTFASISGAYRSLVIYYHCRCDNAAQQALQWRLNNDTGANYDTERTFSATTSAAGLQQVGATSANLGAVAPSGAPASAFSSGVIWVPHYANTNFHKTWHLQDFTADAHSSGNLFHTTGGGKWRDTSAITEIDLFPSAGNFVQHSVFTLYGVT